MILGVHLVGLKAPTTSVEIKRMTGRAVGRIARAHAHEEGSPTDDGWTLVETLVVVLVIGVLMAIAVPTFLGSRNRANNRAAQADLRNALVAAKAVFSNGASYVCARAAPNASCPQALPQYEPRLTYTTAASTTANPRVSVMTTPTATLWAAARMSRSGTCFGIRDVGLGAPPSTVGTWYGQGLATCTGTYASTAARTPNKKWS